MPEYADFGDLREDIFFPGEFDLSQFGNQTMPSVIWSTSGRDHECGDDFYLAAHDDSYSDEDSDKNLRTKEFTSIWALKHRIGHWTMTVIMMMMLLMMMTMIINDKASWSGNASTELGKDLSMDLWENFVSGMSAGYPSIAEYDANVDVRYCQQDGCK